MQEMTEAEAEESNAQAAYEEFMEDAKEKRAQDPGLQCGMLVLSGKKARKYHPFGCSCCHLGKSKRVAVETHEVLAFSLLETGRTQFRRVRLQTPRSVSFLALTKFWGENSVSCSQRIFVCVCAPK